MQKLEIDCKTKQLIYVDLKPEEEIQALQNSQNQLLLEQSIKKENIKKELLRSLIELREMRQNNDVFSQADIGKKQAEIEEIKSRI